MKHSMSIKIFRIFSIFLALSIMVSLFSPVLPVRAEDTFPSPDKDSDGLANTLETAGWYNLAGGPFFTNPNDRDSDNDGLTDGEEKLFNTNPLDSHSPGIAVRYEESFNTKQYFNTTDTSYLKMIQGGDQYLLTEALVVRRGTTFNITGPTTGTLEITSDPIGSMTALSPVKDPARGGWKVSLPANGTVGTYTATITDGTWTKGYTIYVIFELPLPTDLPANDTAAFLYDGDPANKKDEVAVWWRTGEWPYYGKEKSSIQPCPETGEAPTTPAHTVSITMPMAMRRRIGLSSSPNQT